MGNILTDPAIHTFNIAPYYIQEGTNAHDLGINAFFSIQHPECNHLCARLDLKHYITDSVRSKFKEDIISEIQKSIGKANTIICDVCYIFSEITNSEYYKQLENTPEE